MNSPLSFNSINRTNTTNNTMEVSAKKVKLIFGDVKTVSRP